MHFASKLRSEWILSIFQNDITVQHFQYVKVLSFWFIKTVQVSWAKLGILSVFCSTCHHTEDNKNDVTKPEAITRILYNVVSESHLHGIILKLINIDLYFNLFWFRLLFLLVILLRVLFLIFFLLLMLCFSLLHLFVNLYFIFL